MIKTVYIQNKPTAGQTELAFCGIASPDRFTYSITNFGGDELYQLAEYEVENISEIDLVSIAIQRQRYAKTMIAFNAAKYITTQVNGYEGNEAAALLESVLGLHHDEAVLQSITPNQAVDVIFAETNSKKDLFTKIFSTNNYSHLVTGFIKNIVKDTATHVLKICFDKDFFHAILSSDRRLILASAYDYRQPEDVLYVLLNIAKQFGIAVESMQLKLSGRIYRESLVLKIIQSYFPNLMFDELPWKIPDDEKYPGHYFTALYNMATCE